MYDFHYNYIQWNYPDLKLLFTDTDSFTYQIQTDNVYKNFCAIWLLYDFYTSISVFLGTRKKAHFIMIKTKK